MSIFLKNFDSNSHPQCPQQNIELKLHASTWKYHFQRRTYVYNITASVVSGTWRCVCLGTGKNGGPSAAPQTPVRPPLNSPLAAPAADHFSWSRAQHIMQPLSMFGARTARCSGAYITSCARVQVAVTADLRWPGAISLLFAPIPLIATAPAVAPFFVPSLLPCLNEWNMTYTKQLNAEEKSAAILLQNVHDKLYIFIWLLI